MGGRYTIYDPGRDEDYRLELNGIEFSSLAANVYGIHASGIDWTRVAFGLDTLFQSAVVTRRQRGARAKVSSTSIPRHWFRNQLAQALCLESSFSRLRCVDFA
jgi:hypothetical protein